MENTIAANDIIQMLPAMQKMKKSEADRTAIIILPRAFSDNIVMKILKFRGLLGTF
jgi:hypothetical protein